MLVCGCKYTELSENDYVININDPYKVCGQKIYFTNNANEKSIDLKDVIDTIKEACRVNEMENILDEYGISY